MDILCMCRHDFHPSSVRASPFFTLPSLLEPSFSWFHLFHGYSLLCSCGSKTLVVLLWHTLDINCLLVPKESWASKWLHICCLPAAFFFQWFIVESSHAHFVFSPYLLITFSCHRTICLGILWCQSQDGSMWTYYTSTYSDRLQQSQFPQENENDK